MSAIDRRVERLRPPDDFRKVFALATETALVVLTVVVISRRVSGSFNGPIAPALPCLVATLTSIFSLAALALWRQATTSAVTKAWIPATTITLAVLPPVALGAALWVTPSTFVGGYLAALALASLLAAAAIEDSASGFIVTNQLRSALFQRDTSSAKQQSSGGTGGLPASAHSGQSAPSGDNEESSCPSTGATTVTPCEMPIVDFTADLEAEELPHEECETDDSIVQWMTRRRLADGGEVVEGAVKIDLHPAENVGVAHLSFVPPLACDPHAECHLLSEFDGRVRITTARSYGLRIEARHSGEPTLCATINVAFSAQTPPAASRAAAA
jgi:hypothetical protein